MISIRVLLVNPNYHCGGAEIPIGTMTPLGLLYIGGSLIDDGHSVRLIDASKRNLSDYDIQSIIERGRPDAVCSGASASTVTHKRSLEILKIAKRIDPKMVTVLGGVHPTFAYDDIMENHKQVDFIVRGEGEETIKELFRALKEGRPLEDVKGLVLRYGKGYLVNPERGPISDLDSLRPAWELIEDWELYRNGVTNERMAVVGFSRGCPFSCQFCGQWKFWKKYRMRDPRRFVDELEILNRRYGITHFFFADENPSHYQKQWFGILGEIARRNLKVHLTMNLRVTDVIRDRKHLILYKRAGVVYVDLGVESTDQDFLDDSRKRTTTYDNALAISLLRRYDILTIVNLLVGDRRETKNSLHRKFRIVGEWGPDLIMPYVLVPYPWTPFYNKTRKWIRDNDYQNWNYVYPVMEIRNYDKDEFMEDILDNVFWFHAKKLLFSLFFVWDGYRRRSIKAFILKPAVHYFYQRHGFTRPLLGSLFAKQKPHISLNGKGI